MSATQYDMFISKDRNKSKSSSELASSEQYADFCANIDSAGNESSSKLSKLEINAQHSDADISININENRRFTTEAIRKKILDYLPFMLHYVRFGPTIRCLNVYYQQKLLMRIHTGYDVDESHSINMFDLPSFTEPTSSDKTRGITWSSPQSTNKWCKQIIGCLTIGTFLIGIGVVCMKILRASR